MGLQIRKGLMDEQERSVAVRLKTLRERRGWSQNQLALNAEVGNSTISRIEGGIIRSPGIELLGKIASALGVEVSELSGQAPVSRPRVQVYEGTARVPVVRLRVQASGVPAWDDTRDHVPIRASDAAGKPNLFAAVVSGDCMRPYVLHGDTVVINPDVREPQEGQMVVVATESGETLVKWFHRDAQGRPYLAANDRTVMRPNGATIVGVVEHVQHPPIRDPNDPRVTYQHLDPPTDEV